MPAAAVNRFTPAREDNDCAISAIATYLGVTYEDVLREVSVLSRTKGRLGLYVTTIKKVAAALGTTLRKRTKVDLDSDYGILLFPSHCAVLRNGLLLDANGTIWDIHDYLSTHGDYARVEGILSDDQ